MINSMINFHILKHLEIVFNTLNPYNTKVCGENCGGFFSFFFIYYFIFNLNVINYKDDLYQL